MTKKILLFLLFVLFPVSTSLYTISKIDFVEEKTVTKYDYEPILKDKVDLDKIVNATSDLLLKNTVLWQYNRDYTARRLVSASKDINSIIVPALDIVGKPEYQTMLVYHQEKLCYINRVNSMDPKTYLYKSIVKSTETIDDSTFFIACPFFTKGKLEGYISALFTTKSNGVVMQQNLVQLIAIIIGDYIDDTRR